MKWNYSNITIIIPIDFSRRGKQIFQRVKNIIKVFYSEGLRIAIGHRDYGSKYDNLLKGLVNSYGTTKLQISSTTYSKKPLSLGELRNKAVEKATTELILLLDVDIYPDTKIIDSLLERINTKKTFIAMLPCLYLTSKGTEILCKEDNVRALIIKSYFNCSNELVSMLASPSSIVLIFTNDYRHLGGFDENYRGHGYEDFDFLIRLGLRHKILPSSQDLLIDKTYNAPILSEGFRAYLGKISLLSVLNKQFAFHLYHFRNKDENYYQLRKINAQIFERKFAFLKHTPFLKPSSKKYILLDTFYKYCNLLKVLPSDYSVLFYQQYRKGSRNFLSKLWKKFLFRARLIFSK